MKPKLVRKDYITLEQPEKPSKQDMFDYGYGCKTVAPEHAAMSHLATLWDYLAEVPRDVVVWVKDNSQDDGKLYRIEVKLSKEEVEFDG